MVESDTHVAWSCRYIPVLQEKYMKMFYKMCFIFYPFMSQGRNYIRFGLKHVLISQCFDQSVF